MEASPCVCPPAFILVAVVTLRKVLMSRYDPQSMHAFVHSTCTHGAQSRAYKACAQASSFRSLRAHLQVVAANHCTLVNAVIALGGTLVAEAAAVCRLRVVICLLQSICIEATATHAVVRARVAAVTTAINTSTRTRVAVTMHLCTACAHSSRITTRITGIRTDRTDTTADLTGIRTDRTDRTVTERPIFEREVPVGSSMIALVSAALIREDSMIAVKEHMAAAARTRRVMTHCRSYRRSDTRPGDVVAVVVRAVIIMASNLTTAPTDVHCTASVSVSAVCVVALMKTAVWCGVFAWKKVVWCVCWVNKD
jgi:hypothetical protein